MNFYLHVITIILTFTIRRIIITINFLTDMLEELKEKVFRANLDLVKHGLVIYLSLIHI